MESRKCATVIAVEKEKSSMRGGGEWDVFIVVCVIECRKCSTLLALEDLARSIRFGAQSNDDSRLFFDVLI